MRPVEQVVPQSYRGDIGELAPFGNEEIIGALVSKIGCKLD
jgi:hypothetical protein